MSDYTRNNIAVIDTETTGLEVTDDVIEVGIVSLVGDDDLIFSATKAIPCEVSAVHHLTDADVAGRPLFRDYAPALRDDLHRNGVRVLAAHNAEFDRKMLGEEFADFAWICTYKVALHLWPDAPNHKNETLCYYLNVGCRGRVDRGNRQAHSAHFDACQTHAILTKALETTSIDQMIQWTREPKNLPKIMFGKHAGKRWAEIDSGYLGWLVKQADMDADVKACAETELRRRR